MILKRANINKLRDATKFVLFNRQGSYLSVSNIFTVLSGGL